MKITMNKENISILLFMLSLSSAIQADLVVDEAIVIYETSQESKHDVTVYNSDELENIFLEVAPFAVVNPGTATQTLAPLSYEDTSPDFLVTPNRAIIPPGGQSVVRLLNLDTSGAHERVYRINLTPVQAPSEMIADDTGDNVVSNLEVVIAYQLLVIIPPENALANPTYSRDGTTVNFSNSGNANYLLTEGEQCDPADPSVCVPLESRRIYPGNNWPLVLPYAGPAKFTIRTPAGSSAIVVN
jgi:P pilus assembly chaperone PapD